MRGPGHSSALVFSLAAILFALLAGVVIPLSSGGSSAGLDWTPPATSTATSTVALATFTPVAEATVEATTTPTTTPSAVPSPTPAPQTPTPTNTPTLPARARVPQGPLNLRAGPGAAFAVRATANSGDEYVIEGRSEDARWVQLCCVAGSRAWAAAEFLVLPASVESYPVVR